MEAVNEYIFFKVTDIKFGGNSSNFCILLNIFSLFFYFIICIVIVI